MGKTTASIFGIAWFFGAIGVFPGSPAGICADIYRWQDDSGVVHFTDTPSRIPEKYRSRKKMIQQGPAEAGRPGVSTVGPPSPPPSVTPPENPPTPREGVQADREGPSGQAEQLQAKIAAKQRFIEGIDRKRSNALNPLGNRFVSEEDLELYRKYSEELPRDRQRLKELKAGTP